MPPSEQEEHARPHSAAPRAEGPHGGPPAAPLRTVLPADWVAPSIARDRLDRWLRDLGWPAAQREDLVLAASEAVSNSVEHGYRIGAEDPRPRGTAVVDVRAELVVGPDGARRVVLTVRDQGEWREPTAAPHRGHGLRVMRASGDELDVDGGPDGTTVVLTSRPAPPPA